VKAREGFFGKFATLSEKAPCKTQICELCRSATAQPSLRMDSAAADAKLK
jgi:hypothetical protein